MSDDTTQDTLCAAVMATSEDHARQLIRHAHDAGHAEIEWRFANERPADWTPFCERFARRDWMQWPWPTGGAS